jgi:poly(A) polymerase
MATAIPTSVDGSFLPPALLDVRQFFTSRGLRAYLVGGAVRDALLGRKTDDLDVAVETSTSSLLEAARDLAGVLDGRYVLLHQEMGAARVVLSDGPVIDLIAAPRGLARDLGRRDFTVNAMAVSLNEMDSQDRHVDVIDLHDGRADLSASVLRAVSAEAFDDDPVRLLRAPRFAAQLGLSVSDETRTVIRSKAGMLERSSQERVRDELLKIFAAPDPMESIRTLDDLGLLSVVLPELDEAREVSQPKEHYWDVFNHCVETVGKIEAILGPCRDDDDWVLSLVPAFPDMDSYFEERISDGHSRSTLVRLSGLVHDIAKPATKTREENGRIRFLGHHKVGAEVVDGILERLRFGTRGRQFVSGLVRHHLRPKQMAEPGAMPSRRALFRYYREVGEAAIATLYLNMADYLAARGPLLERDEWREHCDLMAYILSATFETPAAPRLINGSHVMDEFGIGPGPLVGKLLDAVTEAQAAGEVETRDDAMRLVGRMLKAETVNANGRFGE